MPFIFNPVKLFETPSFSAEQKNNYKGVVTPDKYSRAEDSTKSTSCQKNSSLREI